MQRQLPGHLLPEDCRLLAGPTEEAGPRPRGLPLSKQTQVLQGPRLQDRTDLRPAAGTLAVYADSEDRAPNFVCGLKGLNPVKDPGFSCALSNATVSAFQDWATSDAGVDGGTWGAVEPFPAE